MSHVPDDSLVFASFPHVVRVPSCLFFLAVDSVYAERRPSGRRVFPFVRVMFMLLLYSAFLCHHIVTMPGRFVERV